MTSPMMTTLQEWQDEFFELVDRIQEPIVKMVGELSESLAEYVPERPAWPFLSQLPTVSEVIDNQAAFAHRFVEQQTQFARSLVKAAQPVLGKLEVKPAPTRKTRKAAAPAAKAAAA